MLVYKQNPCNQQSVTRWGSSRCCKTGWQRRRLHREMSSGMFLFGSVTCHESPLSALSALVLMRFERVCLCPNASPDGLCWRSFASSVYPGHQGPAAAASTISPSTARESQLFYFQVWKSVRCKRRKWESEEVPELRVAQHWNFRETLHILRIRIIERLSENFTGPLSLH